MANTVKYLPGPGVADEFDSLASLRTVLEAHVFAKLFVASVGFGEAGTGPWYGAAVSVGYVANAGLPYLQFTWDDTPGTSTLQLRMRYDMALVGLLDQYSWLPGIFAPIASNSHLEIDAFNVRNSGARWAVLLQSFCTALSASGLCKSGISATSPSAWSYTYGTRTGKCFGVTGGISYAPNLSEQGDDIRRTVALYAWWATDADDGTIGTLTTPGAMGANYSQIPQIIAGQPDQEASWTDLSTEVGLVPPSIGSVKDAIDNSWTKLADDIPGVLDFYTKLPKSVELEDPQAVTHADDQAGDPWTVPLPNPPASAAAAAGFLPAVLAVPVTLAAVSRPVLIRVGSTMATGVAAAEAFRSGFFSKAADAFTSLRSATDLMTAPFFDKLVEFVDWAVSPTGPAATGLEALSDQVSWLRDPTKPAERIATEVERQGSALDSSLEILERIAVALEAIQLEICRDETQPLQKPGLVNAVELASETRSEIEVRYHGLHVSTATGVTVGDDP